MLLQLRWRLPTHPLQQARCKSQRRTLTRAASMPKLLVLSSPQSPELEKLKLLPPGMEVVGIGRSKEELSSLSPDTLAQVDVLLNCGVGKMAATKQDLMALWPQLKGLKCIHSASAGLEGLLFPELVDSPVLVTNAKGVYSNSLAEYALTACNWFAKDLPRLQRAKADRRWEPYEVEELRGKTMGVVGYGDIGQACARLARAFRMRVVGLRRKVELSQQEQEEGLVDAMYAPAQLLDLVAESDYIVMSTPHTQHTDKMMSAAAIAAMRPHAVFVNVGRGKCVDEPALIEALKAHKIRGAALDVFAQEPLPAENELWGLDNVLMSPHCADRTKEFQLESMDLFLANMQLFVEGKQMLNIVDKRAGY